LPAAERDKNMEDRRCQRQHFFRFHIYPLRMYCARTRQRSQNQTANIRWNSAPPEGGGRPSEAGPNGPRETSGEAWDSGLVLVACDLFAEGTAGALSRHSGTAAFRIEIGHRFRRRTFGACAFN